MRTFNAFKHGDDTHTGNYKCLIGDHSECAIKQKAPSHSESVTRHKYVPLNGDVGTWCGHTEGAMTCSLSATAEVHQVDEANGTVAPSTAIPNNSSESAAQSYTMKAWDGEMVPAILVRADYVVRNWDGLIDHGCSLCIEEDNGSDFICTYHRAKTALASKPVTGDDSGITTEPKNCPASLHTSSESSNLSVSSSPKSEWPKIVDQIIRRLQRKAVGQADYDNADWHELENAIAHAFISATPSDLISRIVARLREVAREKQGKVGMFSVYSANAAVKAQAELVNALADEVSAMASATPETRDQQWSREFPHKADAGDSYYFVKRVDSMDVLVAGFSMGKMWINGVAYKPEEFRYHEFLGPLTPDRFIPAPPVTGDKDNG